MRLKITESKNARSLYVIKSIYKDGKHTSKIVEKLGTYAELLKKLNGADPIAWAHQHIDELNAALKEDNQTILVPYSTSKQIRKGEQRSVKGGYLFLAPIYHA
ncbi:MAG: transposase, partial [Clostridia bacterium]